MCMSEAAAYALASRGELEDRKEVVAAEDSRRCVDGRAC